MNIRVRMADPFCFPDWDKQIADFVSHSLFHTTYWARVLKESYGFKPIYIVLEKNKGIMAAMPLMEVNSPLTGKRGVSLPFTDCCDFLTKNPKDIGVLVDSAVRLGKNKGWSYIEWRIPEIELPNTPVYSQYCLHTLQLQKNEQGVYAGFKSNVKRNIKKAKKAGVHVKIENSLEALMAYYDLHLITRKRHGLPPQPVKFFRKIHKHIMANGNGFVALASYQGKNIAGAVYFHFGKNAMYKYGASKREYQHLRANNYLMWEAIKYYCSSGFTSFSFGRTDKNNLGLLQFKRGWGAIESQLNYYRYHLNKNVFVGGHSRGIGFPRIFANMPIPFLKFAGALLYRHFG